MQKFCIYSFLLILMTHSLNVVSQVNTGNFDRYTTNNGLPNDIITDLHLDRKGYLWIATMNGLALYDGNKFDVISDKDIIGHVINQIIEDRNQNIWVAADGITRFKRKSNDWKNYNLTATNISEDKRKDFIKSIVQQNDSVLWCSAIDGVYRFNINSSQAKFYKFPHRMWSNYRSVEYKPASNTLYYLYSNQFLMFDIDSHRFINLDSLKSEMKNGKPEFINKKVYSVQERQCKKGLKHCFRNIETGKAFCIPENKSLCCIFDNNVCYQITEDDILIYDNQFQLKKRINVSGIFRNNKKKIEINTIIKDLNSGFWIGTNDGLFHVKETMPFHHVDKESGLPFDYVRSTHINDSGELLVGGKGTKNIAVFSDAEQLLRANENKTADIIRVYSEDNVLNTFYDLGNGKMVLLSNIDFALFDYKNKRLLQTTNDLFMSDLWAVAEHENKIWFGGICDPCVFVGHIEENKLIIDTSFKEIHKSQNTLTFFTDSDNQLWMGGEGLYKVEKEGGKYYFDEYIEYYDSVNKSNVPVWNILELNKEILIAGTTENGFYFVNKETKEIVHFTKKHGLSSNVISAIEKDINNDLWISTNNGLDFFDIDKRRVVSYTVDHGLVSNDFNFKASAQNSDGWMFWGTKDGLVYFHPDSIQNRATTANLFVHEFKVFDEVLQRSLSSNDTIILDHKQNFFTFEFGLLDFTNPGDIQYDYYLENYDKTIHQTTGKKPYATYTNVSPGDYVFYLWSKDPSDNSNRKQIKVAISVTPAFYQTLVFKIFVVAALILLISTLLIQYIRGIKIEGKLTRTELELLRSQINPHFIFNTLTSIQEYIMENEKHKAFHYVSRFAKLMRMSLEYSKLDFIGIEKALAFLKIYVELESARLHDDILFEIEVEPQVDQERMTIPPMILQPFVENAIKHGLAPLDSAMHLKLSMKKEKKFIKCIISDNGIGRKKAEELRMKKENYHKSMGIDITQKRLSKQQSRKGLHIDENLFYYIDHLDKNGTATGTSVVVNVPYKL